VVMLNVFCNDIILSKDLRNKIHSLLSNLPINRVLVNYFSVSVIHVPPCVILVAIIVKFDSLHSLCLHTETVSLRITVPY
jgi:hypothetical protein